MTTSPIGGGASLPRRIVSHRPTNQANEFH
jgi:hypothetical protein